MDTYAQNKTPPPNRFADSLSVDFSTYYLNIVAFKLSNRNIPQGNGFNNDARQPQDQAPIAKSACPWRDFRKSQVEQPGSTQSKQLLNIRVRGAPSQFGNSIASRMTKEMQHSQRGTSTHRLDRPYWIPPKY